MLVLLDIDGVMVPAFGWKPPVLLSDGFPDFSKKAVLGLNKIISATKASILLTTTHKSSFTREAWEKIFAQRGIYTTIDKIENAIEFLSRKEEVLHWLHEHPEEKNFVIIDDDKSLNDLPGNVKKKLILTSSLIGLNESLADQAIKVLGK